MHIDQIIPRSYLDNLNRVVLLVIRCVFCFSSILVHSLIPLFGMYSVFLQQTQHSQTVKKIPHLHTPITSSFVGTQGT